MVKAMYDGTQSAVVDSTGQLDWFDVKSGVKQGCNMSGFLVLLAVDCVMRRTVAGNNNGITWKLWSKMDDLEFADDIALIYSTRGQLQQKGKRLNLESKGTGLKVNKEKTNMIRMNAAISENIQVDGRDLEDVESFVYLDERVCTSGGADKDIRARLGKAREAYNKLGKIWKNNQFSRMTKIRIFKSNVISVLLYRCETWRMTQAYEKELDTFLHRSLRQMLQVKFDFRLILI